MGYDSNDLERAKRILSQMEEENISSSELNPMLNKIRNLSSTYAHGGIAPGLTACVATTLCKVGLCQELCQRFALEYCLAYQEQNMGLVFLRDMGHGNHAFAYIGKTPNVPDELFVGRGNAMPIMSENTEFSLQDFLTKNPDIIIVDPLLKFANSVDQVRPLLDYCQEHALTHIGGIRDYANTLGFIQQAALIKANAEAIAVKIQDLLKSVTSVITDVGLFPVSKYATPKRPYGPFSDWYSFPSDERLSKREVALSTQSASGSR